MANSKEIISGLFIRIGDRYVNFQNVTHILSTTNPSGKNFYRVYFIGGMYLDFATDTISEILEYIKGK